MPSVGSQDESFYTQPGTNSFAGINIDGQASVHLGNNIGTHHHYHYGEFRPLASPTFDREKYLQLVGSLEFDRMDARMRNISTALPHTCTWIFHHEKFLVWSDDSQSSQQNGCLWIKGKPGCGKSTIMKTALSWTQKNWTNDWIIVSYFFNARATSVSEKSSLGLYQSITHQLLSDLPDFRPLFLDSYASKVRANSVEDWTIPELQEFLVEIARSTRRPRLCLFIDALDEGDEDDVRSMVDFLGRLSSHAASSGRLLRVCLSSRHYPNITISHGSYITVEDEHAHDRDISFYIQQELRAAKEEAMQDLCEQLIQKSKQVFLWLVIVVSMLNKAYDRGDGIASMTILLDKMPESLNGLFSDILSKRTESFDECVILLQWVLFSMRPLRVEELYLAILYTTQQSSHPEPQEMEDALSEPSRVRRCILNWSRGLVEITEAQGKNKSTVQFIHETARNYVLHSRDIQTEAAPSKNFEGVSHEMIKSACAQYLTHRHCPGGLQRLTIMGQEMLMADKSKEYPFIEYSAKFLFHHADRAQQHRVQQRDFLRSQIDEQGICLPTRIVGWYMVFEGLYSRIEYDEYRRSLLCILVKENLLHLVQILVKESISIDVEDGRDKSTAFQIACSKGFPEMSRYLLKHGADVSASVGMSGGALDLAVEAGQIEIVELLLKKGIAADTPGGFYGNALQRASGQGKLETVKLLLRRGAKVNIRGGHYGTAIQAASASGHIEIIELLLINGADVNLQGGTFGNALSAAVWCRQFEVIELLLKDGADANMREAQKHSALETAAALGVVQAVRLLLKYGATDLPNGKCNEYEVQKALNIARSKLSGSWEPDVASAREIILLLEQGLAGKSFTESQTSRRNIDVNLGNPDDSDVPHAQSVSRDKIRKPSRLSMGLNRLRQTFSGRS